LDFKPSKKRLVTNVSKT